MFSQINLWEIAIKQAVGKLPEFRADIEDILALARRDDFSMLPIKNEHIEAYLDVPFFPAHRDPFDRLLIATAIVEGATILTADRHFGLYSGLVPVLW